MKSPGNKRLFLALILLALGAYVMTIDEAAQLKEREERLQVKFPTGLRAKEEARLVERRRPFLNAPKVTAEDDIPKPPVTQDPVLRALGSAQPDESVVVLEVNALRHSKVGQRLIDCLSPEARTSMDRMRDEMGFDILEDFDRLALHGETITIAGHFEDFNWGKMNDADAEDYGDRGRIYSNRYIDDDGNEQVSNYTAVWNNEMIIIGDDEESLQETLDAIEGRTELNNRSIREGDTYGEAYGQINAELLINMLPPDLRHLEDLIRDNISGAQINFDAMDKIAMSATLGPASGSSDLTDLARSLGGSLSLGLSAARVAGEDELAKLLEFARVSDRDGEIKLDLALPENYLNRHLDKVCEKIRMKGQPAPEESELDIDENQEEADDEEAEYEEEDYEETDSQAMPDDEELE
ncbi:MAG: hypothetical protein VX834_04070 [Myxococcota bacterium]|nr:hypothetical protein [Myxococcota bacterium]